MEFVDDELRHFEEHGATPLPRGGDEGYVEHEGARIWYGAYGSEQGPGPAVILLHGGLGHAGNWGYQLPALLEAGYRAVVIDSRGHRRSTRDERPYSYELMAGDVLAVMDRLQIDKAALVGWSDGACTSLILADRARERVAGVFYFACNMDPTGVKPMEPSPVLDRCFARHTRDYAELSPTPEGFQKLVQDISLMQRTQPNYTAEDLARIGVPVVVCQGESDEFIRREHAEYLAGTIPGAELRILPGVSHFAPLQRPEVFNGAVSEFLERVLLRWSSL